MNWFRKNNAPIIVIGMHRSGTTMFTVILKRCGVFMGADLSSNQESYTFTHFNEMLLNKAGGCWNDPKAIDPDTNMEFDQRTFGMQFLHIKREPLNALRFIMGRSWGWKDPRNTFTLPYWINRYFPNARVVHIYRNGLDVARSLSARNKNLAGIERIDALNDELNCFKLWERYLDRAFSLEDELGLSVIHISYEELIEMNSGVIYRLESFLGLKGIAGSVKHVAKKTKSGTHKETDAALKEIANESTWMKKLSYSV